MDEEDWFCPHCAGTETAEQNKEPCPYCENEDEGEIWGAEVRDTWITL